MKKAKATRRRTVNYGDYGKVRVLRVAPTDRGGLALIAVRVPANDLFKKASNQQFWVRAGAVGKPRYPKKISTQIQEIPKHLVFVPQELKEAPIKCKNRQPQPRRSTNLALCF